MKTVLQYISLPFVLAFQVAWIIPGCILGLLEIIECAIASGTYAQGAMTDKILIPTNLWLRYFKGWEIV